MRPRRKRPPQQAQPLLLALALCAPLVIWVEISLVGRLFITEVILVGALPFLLLTRGRMLTAPMPRMFLLFALAWLLAQIATDLYRGTPFVDYSRGWSKIMFTALNFSTIYLLVYGSRTRIVAFGIGIAFGGYLAYLFNPSDFAISQPWKFGVGTATITLATIAATWPPIARRFLLPTLIIGTLAALSLYVGARSLAGVTIVTALYMLLQQILSRRGSVPARFSPARSFAFLLFGLAVTAGFLQIYGMVAGSGALGDLAREKYERQAGGAFGVLLGGRSEIFVSTKAIMDSPLLGHGSWAKDPQYSVLLLELEDVGYEVNYLAAEEELIPSHSHLFGAWVESGVIGALFWLWILSIVFRVMSNLFLVREPLAPLITFFGFLMFWDILFSPFGAERRILMPFYIVVMMFAWETLRVSVPDEALMRFRKLVPRRRRDDFGDAGRMRNPATPEPRR